MFSLLVKCPHSQPRGWPINTFDLTNPFCSFVLLLLSAERDEVAKDNTVKSVAVIQALYFVLEEADT